MAMAALPEEIEEEILMRIPPDDPASLVRAAVVCKPWGRLISGAGFGRRYRVLHRSPPMLGFFHVRTCEGIPFDSGLFVPTSRFRPSCVDRPGWQVIDARHGRILLHPPSWGTKPFIVWDPITGVQQELPLLNPLVSPCCCNAAVFCAIAGACDHLDCHHGPFNVVLVSTTKTVMFVYIYSSDVGVWSELVSTQRISRVPIKTLPSVLVRNALYFAFHGNKHFLKYELGTQKISVICIPPSVWSYRRPVTVLTMENDMLGFATVINHNIHLWSRKVDPVRGSRFELIRVIELETLLPAGTAMRSSPEISFADGAILCPHIMAYSLLI
ncbi:hypothetical protein ACP4OV_012088 [Aristida adscensionis]